MRRFIASIVVRVTIALALMFATTRVAPAQTLQVLHAFTGGGDGARPSASLTFDARGNLYGTTIYGGHTGGPCQPAGCGTVFKLTHTGSGWILNPLYSFTGGNDGMNPAGSVVSGPDGLLYGTTYAGGGNGCSGTGCGTVFSLGPPAHACTSALCPWTETILHRFSGDDGQIPNAGVVFDANDNLYGTTAGGGHNFGTVYELTRTVGGGWTEQVLHYFANSPDGALPAAGLIFDAAGNLYGTTYEGGTSNYGTVFELMPTQGGGWTEQVLYSFYQGTDGYQPLAGLIFDAAGNLYGTTSLSSFPVEYTGVVFELTPTSGGWTEQVLHQFQNDGLDGDMPVAGLIFDPAGTLYGTTSAGGTSNDGTVFQLTPTQGGGWTEQVLHSFMGAADGSSPAAGLILDAAGNLYGTAQAGGTYNAGTVFELSPGGEVRDSSK